MKTSSRSKYTFKLERVKLEAFRYLVNEIISAFFIKFCKSPKLWANYATSGPGKKVLNFCGGLSEKMAKKVEDAEM